MIATMLLLTSGLRHSLFSQRLISGLANQRAATSNCSGANNSMVTSDEPSLGICFILAPERGGPIRRIKAELTQDRINPPFHSPGDATAGRGPPPNLDV